MSHNKPANVKQVIVMRTDTDPPMRKGKMIAQGAHASIAFLTRRIQQNWKVLDLTPEMKEWMLGRFTKVCLRVDSEEELLNIHKEALRNGLESHLITDSGQTEFGGQPTNTCLAVGPNRADEIDQVTGHLRLL